MGTLFVLMNIRLCPFTTFFTFTPLQLQKHRIANWIYRSRPTSGTVILKVRDGNKFVSGASEKFLTTTMLKVHFCGPLWGEGRWRGPWSWKAHESKGHLPVWAHSVHGPLYLLRVCVALYTYIWPFSTTCMGSFHLPDSIPRSEVGVVGSGSQWLLDAVYKFSYLAYTYFTRLHSLSLYKC